MDLLYSRKMELNSKTPQKIFFHSYSPRCENLEKHVLTKLGVQIKKLVSESCKNCLCYNKFYIVDFEIMMLMKCG
jgi:hypothetical protein